MKQFGPVLSCLFLTLTILACPTSTLQTTPETSPSLAPSSPIRQSQVSELKTLSEQLMNSVLENKTEKIEELARKVVTIANELVRGADMSKNLSQKAIAEQILQTGTALQQIGKDGTIAENGMLLEKLHQLVLKYMENEVPVSKPMRNSLCPVSGKFLGSMQKGSSVVYNGQEIGLCCDGCKPKFLADPSSNVKKAETSISH